MFIWRRRNSKSRSGGGHLPRRVEARLVDDAVQLQRVALRQRRLVRVRLVLRGAIPGLPAVAVVGPLRRLGWMLMIHMQ